MSEKFQNYSGLNGREEKETVYTSYTIAEMEEKQTQQDRNGQQEQSGSNPTDAADESGCIYHDCTGRTTERRAEPVGIPGAAQPVQEQQKAPDTEAASAAAKMVKEAAEAAKAAEEASRAKAEENARRMEQARQTAEEKMDAMGESLMTVAKSMQQLQQLGRSFSEMKDLYTGAYLTPGLTGLCKLCREMNQSAGGVSEGTARYSRCYAEALSRILRESFGCTEWKPVPGTAFDSLTMEKERIDARGTRVLQTKASGWKLGDRILLKATVSVKEEW